MDEAQELVSRKNQSCRVECPSCGKTRKKKGQKTLSITVESDVKLYYCHHCEIQGAIESKPFYEDYIEDFPPVEKTPVVQIPTKLNMDTELIQRFFSNRGIEIDSIGNLPSMVTGQKYFHGVGNVDAVGFVYQDEAIKWRAVDTKNFTQDGSARTFYGLEKLSEAQETIYIVEGEADCVALASVGIQALSVPNGAPAKISNRKMSPEEDVKFSYVFEAKDLLESAEKIILATDNDEAGVALQEELARRIGRAKCWKIAFPEGTKDITDVIAEHGSDTLKEIIDKASPMPLSGVYSAMEYMDDVENIYVHGTGRGFGIDIECVDNLFTTAPGQLTVVTGMPNSGKSEWLDFYCLRLAQLHSMKFAVCSFENPPHMHISKIAEKIIGKSFFGTPDSRMNREELHEAMTFINSHFVFLENKSGELSTMESILSRTRDAILRMGIRGLIIDPYNFIDHDLTNEHQSISKMLTQITAFASANDIHVWFVAHPSKMPLKEDGTYPVPKGTSISGSMSWFSKPAIGLTVHRKHDDIVEIHCWKSRFKHIGQQGTVELEYDLRTGCYFEKSGESFSSRYRGRKHYLDDLDEDF